MDEDLKPVYSPYLLITIPLEFADGCVLHIPPHLLSQSPKLAAMYEADELNFPDVPSDVGHTIIHFLYTGTYQPLQAEYSGAIKALAVEFSISIRTYNAAKTYALPILAELAKVEVERVGEMLQVTRVFEILRNVCPDVDSDEVWLRQFLKNRLKSFLRDGFLKPLQHKTGIPRRIGTAHKTVTINHILFKGMLELFREQEAPLRKKTHDTFEMVAGDHPGFPHSSRYLFAMPVVESNQFIGELEGSLFEPTLINKNKGEKGNPTTEALENNDSEDKSPQDIGTGQHEESEKSYDIVGPLNEKEEKDAGEQIDQDTAKVAEEAAIAEEEVELARLMKARATSPCGLDISSESRLFLLHERAKDQAEGQASHKAGKSAKGKVIKVRKGNKGKGSYDSNLVEFDHLSELTANLLILEQQTKDKEDKENKENIEDSWVSHGQSESKGKQTMDRDSVSNAPICHSSDNDSPFNMGEHFTRIEHT
ncbi:uncharacterized protein Triagg1_5040 [Trichoderma aggressivum f. europaeum]|uniref:BTB domain-containing protein n=1 Tax=Trichoderma aggressivum f. europaeum TaxID=173218 RepID=A0AAE1J9Z4_9HYPO|nr:hypothetical protein Triagg1_5040 [Trichoderma aggressivum f. europaeum]